MNHILFYYALVLAICSLSVNAQETSPIAAKFLYPVKFQCGGSSEAFQEGVVRGMHFTSISIHNPSNQRAVNFTKQVSRALPFQRSDQGSQVVVDTLQPQASIDIECNELRMLLPQSMTTQFRSGFLRIHATDSLSIVAVYSSRPRDADVSTIDVETIVGSQIRSGGDPGNSEQPDLIVSSINLRTLQNSCPSGSGSCRTSVEISVENIGLGDSGAFDVEVTFDPEQSVVFTQPVPGGLTSGEKVTFIASAKTGGNCYDPNCQICSVTDSKEVVVESDESNNKLCRTKQG